VPDELVDYLMPWTGNEFKVLMYVVRTSDGNKSADNISWSCERLTAHI